MKAITLATLPQTSAQDVFNQAAKHLLTQNAKSVKTIDDVEDSCCYRGDEDRRCAAGCFMSDEEYKEQFENSTWEGLVRASSAPKEHAELIIRLQQIHDKKLVFNWRLELESLAQKESLQFIF